MNSGHRGIAAMLAMLLCVAWCSKAEELGDAIQSGLVVATITGRGGSSGDTIEIQLYKTPKAGDGPLTIVVSRGLFLDSSNGAYQDMVVNRVRGRIVDAFMYEPLETIVLESGGAENILAEAYCAEFEKQNPSSSTQFNVTKTDEALACVLERAKADDLSMRATQAAIWIVTDSVTFEKLSSKFPVSAEEWSAAEEVAASCAGLPRAMPPQKKTEVESEPKPEEKPKPGSRAKGTGTVTFSDPRLEEQQKREQR